MSQPLLILVCDQTLVTEDVRRSVSNSGVQLKVYSTQEWSEGLENPFFRNSLGTQLPGSQVNATMGATMGEAQPKVIPFPQNTRSVDLVQKIDQIEAQAIENAILRFRGNLTEAARALGIGRATLYRKVKLYNLDPSMARRKRAA